MQSVRSAFRKYNWYKWLYRWLRQHPAAAGWWAAVRGNRVRIEGCVFQINAPGASNEFKGEFVLDRYEHEERTLLRQYLDVALPVIELGAGIGVVACITNKRLLHPDQHFVVEANPGLIPLLERNRNQNAARFQYRNVAYSAQRTEEVFRQRSIYTISATSDVLATRGEMQAATGEAEITVPASSLAALLDQSGFAQCTLICDIEGSEYPLIDNEISSLSERVAWFFVEFHAMPAGDAMNRCIAQLGAHGFQHVDVASSVHAFRNGALIGADHVT